MSFYRYADQIFSTRWLCFYIVLTIQLFVTLSASKELTDGLDTDSASPLKCSSNSQQSELNSFLWTLKRNPPSYLFGTIHVPYTRVWDYIPQSTKDAFRYSDNVYFELDLTDVATAAALTKCQLLPNGKTINEYISRKLYKRLNRHMEYIRRKIPDWMGADQRNRGINSNYADYQYRAIVGAWQRMRPVWLMLLLNSLTENDVRLFGVPVLDLYLSRQAVLWHKTIGAIERVEEQCEPLNRLNNTQVVFALDQTLKQHEEHRRRAKAMPQNDDLITHYNCGDLKSVLLQKDTLQVDLAALQQQEPAAATMAKEMDEYFQTELLYRRNMVMSERIISLLEENPNKSFFFAFGAGHFLGNNSVIDRLIASGLQIEHTKPESSIQSHSKRDSYKQEPFSQMDSSLLIASHPYMQAIKRLDQAGTAGRAVRHGKNKVRRKSKDDRVLSLEKSSSNEPAFTKLWIKVEEISQVTEDTNIPGYQRTHPPLLSGAVSAHSHSIMSISTQPLALSYLIICYTYISLMLLKYL